MSVDVRDPRGAGLVGGTWDLFRYPGIRSDSDMYTLGYPFRPWADAKATADGPSILSYVRQTAMDYGIDQNIRFHHGSRVPSGQRRMRGGRWRRGEATRRRTADIGYADRRVVVIGSGATAVTLGPAKIWIARGPWQEHLKRGGEYYHARARELESLHAEHPAVGADIAAVANYALAELLERCRVQKLTRHQHILMRPGAVIAQVDGLATLARRAQRAATKQLDPSASKRLRDEPLAALSRVNARGAARTIATEAVRWVAAADGGELDGLPRTAPRSLFDPSRSGRVARPSAEGRRRGPCRARTSLTYLNENESRREQ